MDEKTRNAMKIFKRNGDCSRPNIPCRECPICELDAHGMPKCPAGLPKADSKDHPKVLELITVYIKKVAKGESDVKESYYNRRCQAGL